MVPAMHMVATSRFRYSALGQLVPWRDAELDKLHVFDAASGRSLAA